MSTPECIAVGSLWSTGLMAHTARIIGIDKGSVVYRWVHNNMLGERAVETFLKTFVPDSASAPAASLTLPDVLRAVAACAVKAGAHDLAAELHKALPPCTLAPCRRRLPQNLRHWPASMNAEDVEQAIDLLCGCQGKWDCNCVSVFNQARSAAWEKVNTK